MGPVSYTHLDVYKRQAFEASNDRVDIMEAEGLDFLKEQGMTVYEPTEEAVSYTHLDVYKRQGPARFLRLRFGSACAAWAGSIQPALLPRRGGNSGRSWKPARPAVPAEMCIRDSCAGAGQPADGRGTRGHGGGTVRGPHGGGSC